MTPELDLYAAGNPNQPPYARGLPRSTTAPHSSHVCAASPPRSRTELDLAAGGGRPNDAPPFVVHGTLADPRVLDPAIDPNEREPGVSFLGDPRVVNDGPIGLARFCSLRSWLSQWSVDDANADGVRAALPR